MRLLSNKPKAINNRRYRIRQDMRGLCTRCTNTRTAGMKTCWDCRQQILRNIRAKK